MLVSAADIGNYVPYKTSIYLNVVLRINCFSNER